jgi:hypothetical protein
MAMRKPAEIVDELERRPDLPPGAGERFYGYGVMGLPFESGHVLGSGVSRSRPSAGWPARCRTAPGARTGCWRSCPARPARSLRPGGVRLAGVTPNGQRFTANPLKIWVASSSRATIGGRNLGEMGPAPEQAHLGDFAIPQRGLFVVGRAFFDDTRRA